MIEAVLLMLPAIVALIYGETEGISFVITAGICLAFGFVFKLGSGKQKNFFAREGFVTVALSWLLLSMLGALPFVISKSIPNFVDALFESMSGFTTTGASVVSDVEALPKCMNMWRCFMHWIGGMGILVFVLAVVPLTGGSNMYLMKAESPGPSIEKLVPKLKNTAIILYGIYAAMTVIMIIALLIAGMPVFDSVALSFGTAGTGGFGIANDSCGGYSTSVQVIITVFMILFGINFNVYFLIVCRKFKSAFKNVEARTYLIIIFVAITIITVCIAKRYSSVGLAVKDAAFQVGSIITTSGFSTVDYNLWSETPKFVLCILMLIGACAGSTGGGMKVSRLIILFKTIKRELFKILHPQSVKKITMDGKNIEEDTVRMTMVYFAAYVMIIFVSILIISLDNFSFTSNVTAVFATFNNIGPGLDVVGPAGNFSVYSPLSKIVMIFDMFTGRLEIFPVLLLLSPKAWRRS